MAQNFNYTDASGVECTYDLQGNRVDLIKIVNIPASVTKWVVQDSVPYQGQNYPLFEMTSGSNIEGTNSTLKELVVGNEVQQVLTTFGRISGTEPIPHFSNLHKVTLGKKVKYLYGNDFSLCPLDTVIFTSTDILNDVWGDGTFISAGVRNAFNECPAKVKVFIPCGTMALFVKSFPGEWDPVTTANLIESPCLNTLTILSSDVAKGDAYSFAGCGFVTTTPDNTSAQHSGLITLLALPRGGNVFLGWNDGNLENPRVVNVTADVTYTAQFAACTQSGIESVQANAPLKVFPNPTNNIVNVELERATVGTLALFDLSGRVVETRLIASLRETINLSALAAGTYILRLVENGNASEGVKIVKQ